VIGRQGAINRPFDRSRSRVAQLGLIPQAVDDPDAEIARDPHLTGETQTRALIGQSREALLLGFRARSTVAIRDHDATGRAAGVATSAMEDIDAGILQAEHQSATTRTIRRSDSLDLNRRQCRPSLLR
jgi:hypothetical protein